MNSHVILKDMFQVKLMKVVWHAKTQIAKRSPQTRDITFEKNLGCLIEEVDMIKICSIWVTKGMFNVIMFTMHYVVPKL
jgi:hypothetical protein